MERNNIQDEEGKYGGKIEEYWQFWLDNLEVKQIWQA